MYNYWKQLAQTQAGNIRSLEDDLAEARRERLGYQVLCGLLALLLIIVAVTL